MAGHKRTGKYPCILVCRAESECGKETGNDIHKTPTQNDNKKALQIRYLQGFFIGEIVKLKTLLGDR